MAQYNHLPVFQTSYQLTLEIYQAARQFPREFKYSLGQILKEMASGLMNTIVEANSAEEKAESLERARLKLEQIRIHLRLASDLKILGLNRFEIFSRLAEEISKQLSGWLEWAVNNRRR